MSQPLFEEIPLILWQKNSQAEQRLPDYIILIFQPQRVIYFAYSDIGFQPLFAVSPNLSPGLSPNFFIISFGIVAVILFPTFLQIIGIYHTSLYTQVYTKRHHAPIRPCSSQNSLTCFPVSIPHASIISSRVNSSESSV